MARTTIHSDYIPDNAITGVKIAENSITAREIATNAITTLYIADDSITADKLANSINTDIATGPAALPKAGGTMTGALVVNGDANPALEVSRGSANTTNVNLKYNTTLTGQLSAADAKFQISASGGATEMEFYTNGAKRVEINTAGKLLVGSTTNLGTGLVNVAGGLDISDSDYPYLKLKLASSESIVEAAGAYQNMTIGGTGAHAYLRFKTADTERIRIKSDGNVGIGQTNPVEILDVSGGDCVLKLDSTSNGSGVSWVKFADQGTVKWGIGLSKNSGNSGADFTFYEDASSGTPRLTIKDGGNVGIATTSPSAQLSVVGSSLTNVSTTGIPAIRAQGGYGGGIGLLDTKEAGWYAQDNGDTLYQYVGRTVGSDTPASKVIMTYKSSGKVGIGETTPDDTLHVNASGGTARLRIGSGNDAYYTSKGYLGDTWYFGSGETGDVVTSTISGGAFTSSNAGGAFVWKTDNSGTLSEKMRIRSDGVVTTPEQCYFLAVRTSNLSGYNFAAVSGAVTPIFTSIVSAQSSASGTAAFSTTDGTFSAPVDGLYLFHISFYSNVTIEQAWLTANGGRISYTDMVANTNASYTTGVFSASIQYYMTAGSSIRIHPYSSGSTSDYVYDNAYHTYWKGVLLG